MVHYVDLIASLFDFVGYKTNVEAEMYDDSTSPIYLYCVDKDPVFITELSKRANYLGAMFNNTDRPMFILHYNPNKSPLFIDDPNYSIAKADINGSKYFNITLKNER